MQRQRLLRGARSDVSGLTQLVIREDLQSQEDAAIKTVADVTKRVSTVVAGDPSYIQTADGARYFPGAMMPTGHRLVVIEGQSIVLEKNGRQIRLSF
jgi:type III secretion protein D